MKFVAKLKEYRLKKLLMNAQKHYDDEKHLKAVQRYDRVLKLMGYNDLMNRAIIYERIGDIYFELELNTEACNSYKLAIKIHPNSERVHFVLGLTYSFLDNYKMARKHFYQAYWLAADDIDLLRKKAEFLKENGFVDISIQWFKRVNELNGDTYFE